LILAPDADRDLVELALHRFARPSRFGWVGIWESWTGEFSERALDALRPQALKDLLDNLDPARPDGSGTARTRAALRLRVEPFLAKAATEPLVELEHLHAAQHRPAEGYRSILAREPRPDRRREMFESWCEAEDRSSEIETEINRCEDQAATSCGTGSALDLRAATHSAIPAAIRDDFRRNLVEPGDDEVEPALRGRRLRSTVAFGPEPDEAEQPALAWLAEHATEAPASRAVVRLRDLAGTLSRVEGFAVERGSRSGARTEVRARNDGIVLSLAVEGGLGPFRDGLEQLGRALRLVGVTGVRGREAAWSGDPVWSHAMGAVFRRLLLNRVFPEWAGIDPAGGWRADVVHEEWLRPRREWAVLDAVLASDGRLVVDGGWRRATGWNPTPGVRTRALRPDPEPAERLRGEALGALLEEHLLSAFGWRWFLDRAAGRWLTELFAAEPDGTPDEVARAYGLGTMDAHATSEVREVPRAG
jgi:hypothetical protein